MITSKRMFDSFWLRASLCAALAVLVGCAPKIGDSCTRDIDCSKSSSDRRCDQAQPGGYCTTFGCNANACPDKAVCVLYNAAVPGCSYNDRDPARVGRSFCMASCDEDDDCRDGYVCADPKTTPWYASILDANTGRKVCSVPVSYARAVVDAPVCGGGLPMSTALDASTFATPTLNNPADAGVVDGGAVQDAGADDAGVMHDAGSVDAAAGAADAGAGTDAGAVDASS